MYNFKEAAIRETSISPLLNGRDKLTTDELISAFPDGVTIIGFDMITLDDDTFPVFVFQEDDSKFVFAGTILQKIFERFIFDFDGVIADASDALKESGGLKVRFYKTRTKKGNNITMPEILD